MIVKLGDLRGLASPNTQTQVRYAIYLHGVKFTDTNYHFSDSAASAVRNLNDHEIMGRKLRVDFSNEGVSDGDGDGDNRRDRDGTVRSISYHQ